MGTVIKKLENSIKRSKNTKENQAALIDFKDVIYEDLLAMITDASNLESMTSKIIKDEDHLHSDTFVINKATDELERLRKYIESLNQSISKDTEQIKVSEMHRAYRRMMRTYKSMRSLREYVYRMKEDRVIYELSNK